MFTDEKHRDAESTPYRQLQQLAENLIKTGERMKACAAQMDSNSSEYASASSPGEAPGAKTVAENSSGSASAPAEAPGAKTAPENSSAKTDGQD